MIGGQNQLAIRSNVAKPGNIIGPQGEPGENPRKVSQHMKIMKKQYLRTNK